MPARSSEPGTGAAPRRAETVLALDAAGAACSAALWRGGRVVARRFEAMARGQAERLVPMAEAVMAEAGQDYAALDAIAVTLGPGGFTGVRIGLAAARGLALACGRPVLGVTSFEAAAASVPEAERAGRTLAVVLDAKRADLYAQAFDARLAPLTGPLAAAPEALDALLPLGPLLLAGDALDQARPALAGAGRALILTSVPGRGDAAVVAALAAGRPLPPPGSPPPAPLYLRGPDVTAPDVTAPGAGPAAAAGRRP